MRENNMRENKMKIFLIRSPEWFLFLIPSAPKMSASWILSLDTIAHVLCVTVKLMSKYFAWHKNDKRHIGIPMSQLHNSSPKLFLCHTKTCSQKENTLKYKWQSSCLHIYTWAQICTFCAAWYKLIAPLAHLCVYTLVISSSYWLFFLNRRRCQGEKSVQLEWQWNVFFF